MAVPILRKDDRPWYDEGKEELNDAARRSGFTETQIEHAHRVASGQENLSEKCSSCGEQALRYQRRVRLEGRCAIVCDNCGAHYVDQNELGGVSSAVGKKLKGIVGRPQG